MYMANFYIWKWFPDMEESPASCEKMNFLKQIIFIIVALILMASCTSGRSQSRTHDYYKYNAAREERIKELEEKKWQYSNEEQKAIDQELYYLKNKEIKDEDYDFGDLLIDLSLGNK